MSDSTIPTEPAAAFPGRRRPGWAGALRASLAAVPPGRLLLVAFGCLLVFRLWLAASLPLTADEAYYVDTGRHPDWGIYDHPAMISWWLAFLLRFSDQAWWLRLPSVLLPLLLALAVRSFLPRAWPGIERSRVDWAALLVALAPVNVWNVLITTDTPLIYFAVLSGLAWLVAAERDDLRWYLASGLLLAGALLSKYFAFPLGLAYLIDVGLRGRRRAWLGLLVAYLCTLPALALMAWWNAGHCWVNVMFNFFTRTEDAGLSWKTPLLYAATLAYTLTPPALLKLRRGAAAPFAPDSRSASLLAVAPLSFFALLSLVKVVGLHWILAFVVFAFLPLARSLPALELRRLAAFFAAFAALHVVAIVAVARLPLETWQGSKHYPGIVLTVDGAAILGALEPYEGRYVFASDNYAVASTLGYAEQRLGRSRFIVFGKGSYHGRQDDLDTDFRTLDGRDILILSKTASAADSYRRYFRDTETVPMERHGARFWIILGRGFDYQDYRDTVLADIRDSYYALPAWLPQGACFICDRYFAGRGCGG